MNIENEIFNTKIGLTTKDYLDWFISLGYAPEYIISIFTFNKKFSKSFFNIITSEKNNNKAYNKIFKKINKKNLDIAQAYAKEPKEYFDLYHVLERAYKKQYIDNRVKKYAAYKKVSSKTIRKFYLENYEICEQEIFYNVMKSIYGENYYPKRAKQINTQIYYFEKIKGCKDKVFIRRLDE